MPCFGSVIFKSILCHYYFVLQARAVISVHTRLLICILMGLLVVYVELLSLKIDAINNSIENDDLGGSLCNDVWITDSEDTSFLGSYGFKSLCHDLFSCSHTNS